MKKYVFDKSIYLGLLKKSFNAGDVIEMDENCVIINGEQINDLRDVKICVKKGYIIPFEDSRFDKVEELKDEVVESKPTDSFYGFKVDREDDIGKSIPLSKFRPTVIDESKAFAEEDGQIVEATGIHVAPAQTKTEITGKTKVEADDVVEPLTPVKKTAKKTTTAKTKTTKTTTAKTTKKTAEKADDKKSKIDSSMSIETEKIEGSVRGMNIIKSE